MINDMQMMKRKTTRVIIPARPRVELKSVEKSMTKELHGAGFER
jgi:hypothetical protein